MAKGACIDVLQTAFEKLAVLYIDTQDARVLDVARAIAKASERVDCSGDEMGCDESLIVLGLLVYDRGEERNVYWYEDEFKGAT